jgi:hypothetical protein
MMAGGLSVETLIYDLVKAQVIKIFLYKRGR